MTWLRIRLGLIWNINLILLLTCLLATGHMLTLTQATIGLQAHFNHAADLAFKALKACTPAYFRNLVQQSGESLTDVLSHVTEAVERPVSAGPAKTCSSSSWHGRPNTPTCNAVAAVRNAGIHKWLVAIRDLDPGAGPIAALTASTDALVMECIKGRALFLKGSLI